MKSQLAEWTCETCGIDVPRATAITAESLFYTVTYQCPKCSFVTAEMQAAVNHMADRHVRDLAAYFDRVTGG